MNIYDEIRSKLTNKQVARYYLGEPQQHSGNSIGYCSPGSLTLHQPQKSVKH